MKHLLATVSILGLLIIPAKAESDDINIKLRVSGGCNFKVDTKDIDFGTVYEINQITDKEGSYTVKCKTFNDEGIKYSVSLNKGNNSSNSDRRLKSEGGNSFIKYQVWQGKGQSFKEWGEGKDSISDIARDGINKGYFTVVIPDQLDVELIPSLYKDTVTATITYNN